MSTSFVACGGTCGAPMRRATVVARQRRDAQAVPCRPCGGVAAPAAAAAARRHRLLRSHSVPPGVQALGGPEAQLAADLEEMMSGAAQMEAEEVAARVAAIEARSAALGTAVVDATNDGSFLAAPLSGRLKAVTGAAAKLTMGGLTFGAVQPADLELAFRPLPPGVAPIFKGERQGVAHAYTVTSAFSVPAHNLAAVCEVVGTYCQDGDNPQRLHIQFTDVVITPVLGEAGEGALQRWLALFAGANAAGVVDAGSGQISVPLAGPATATHLDYLVMTPAWQMTRSGHGSIALLKRA